MYVCYGNTFWSNLFSFFEIISIAFLAYLYTKYTANIRKTNEIQNYENIDLIIIFLSIIQVYLMLFSLVISNNFGFAILQEILKFTQNIIIWGLLLLQICIWQKFPIALYIVKNYVYVFILFNLFILLCGFFFEYSFLEINFCYSIILKILPVLAFVFNLILIAMAIYNNYQEQSESRKNGAMIYENDNLGAIIEKFSSSLQKMRKYYLIFIIYFTVSYFVDVYFKFSNIKYDDNVYNYKSSKNNTLINNNNLNNKNTFSDNIISNNTYIYNSNAVPENESEYLLRKNNITNNLHFNSALEINKQNNFWSEKDIGLIANGYRILIEKQNKITKQEENKIIKSNNVFITKYISACEYYKDLGDKYSFKELLVCFISFVFRDIGPHVYIFISLFIYKPETLSRSSSFIEI